MLQCYSTLWQGFFTVEVRAGKETEQGRGKCPGHSGYNVLISSTHPRIMNTNLYQHAQPLEDHSWPHQPKLASPVQRAKESRYNNGELIKGWNSLGGENEEEEGNVWEKGTENVEAINTQ